MELVYQDLGQGITCIETYYQRPNLACCYMLEDQGEVAFIDTGTARTVPLIMALLERKGISPGAVKYVMPTHVHLDHAGATGQLMELFPNAQLIIHPYGARHMIDPTKLIAGSIAVYGEEAFKRDYDELKAVEESRVIEASDGYQVTLGQRKLLCLDTPGHARHHLCFWDEQTQGFFTGDTFGISYPEFNTDQGGFVFLPTTPVQFDPDAWHQTLDRLMSYSPQRMYLTHFCRIEQTEAFARELHRQIDDYVDIARNADPDHRYQSIHNGLNSYFRRKLEEHGCQLSDSEIEGLLDLDLGLCAQGLEIWLQRQA